MYNRSEILKRAWGAYRKQKGISWSECQKRSWRADRSFEENDSRIRAAKEEAGIEEETKTWNDWKLSGYEVIHGSKSLFGCDLIYAMKGEGAIYKARFFGRSQVLPIGQQATA